MENIEGIKFTYGGEEYSIKTLIDVDTDIFIVVETLPDIENAELNKIYLLHKTESSGSNYLEEWAVIEKGGVKQWEKLGDVEVSVEFTEIQDMITGVENRCTALEGETTDLDNRLKSIEEDTYTKTEVDNKIDAVITGGEVDLNNYYTKDETNDILGGKVNNDRVLTDVPANAKFTDTVYNDTAIRADIALKAYKTYVDTQDIKKQDKLIAGTNITILDSTISATDTVYDDTAIKADITKKADKVDTYTKAEADNKFNVKFSSGITDIVFVDVLPEDREDNILYLVKED